MNKKTYDNIHETLYSKTLENGLKVFLLPKPDYHKVYGLFSTNYGSIDCHFIPMNHNKAITVPDGIAHFLEHKLFEKEDGDVFFKFSNLGANSNAFTTFSRTSYLFSCVDNENENLELLLDFVQTPYFTEDSVNKEKGIIASEINMYQDDPNWRLFFGVLQNMYPNHPISIDIAGSVESIQKITAVDLYTCYKTFYHPSNMTLFVVGNFDAKNMMENIEKNQNYKSFDPPTEIKRLFPTMKNVRVKPSNTIQMEVVRPKFAIGIRGDDELPTQDIDLLKYKFALSLYSEAIFGDTSENFLSFYNNGILDDTFEEEFNLDREVHFLTLSGDSDEPQLATKKLIEILLNPLNQNDLNEENIELLKRNMIGKFYQSLNSLEFIANQFTTNLYGNVGLFDVLEIIESVTMEDIQTAVQKFFKPENITTFYIFPNS